MASFAKIYSEGWNLLKTVLIEQILRHDLTGSRLGLDAKRRRLAAFYKGLEYTAMRWASTVKQTCALHRFIRLRQRYILTKENRVRMRYVLASVSVFVLATGVMAQAFTGHLSGLDLSRFARSQTVATGQDKQPATEISAADVQDTLRAHISSGMRKASAAVKKPPGPTLKEMKIGNGDTFAGVLQSAGVGAQDVHYVVEALSEHYDPRKIRAGQMISVNFKPAADGTSEFTGLSMKIDPVKEVKITRKNDKEFTSVLNERALTQRSYAKRAEIETSLYGSAARAGIPPQVIAEVIRIYSWDIDFQRDIRQGDHFEVLYDTRETEDGDYTQYGDILYANLSVGGRDIPIYRYEMKDGRIDYFQPDGHSIRKALMKTPIDGARISSGFGMRHHPVLGYNKMHKGMDFAAPTGTPIYAAGDGTIDYAGRKGGYGNYVRIRHNSTLKTAYAHMHKFAKGITKGKYIKQGDVIGYVGTTGRSTGPHLHYEVLVKDAQVNPRSLDLPTGEQLEGDELKRFKSLIGIMHQQYVSLSEGLKFAQASDESKENRRIR